MIESFVVYFAHPKSSIEKIRLLEKRFGENQQSEAQLHLGK